MKRHAYLMGLAACLMAGSAIAQDKTATFETREGPLVVNWGQPPARDPGPAPAWAQMDANGDGHIDSSEASAYPLLANDFKYADANRDGRISRAEYERWVGKQ